MLLAYDDPAGVTAAFNRNLLARINRELDADFVLRISRTRRDGTPGTGASRCICDRSRRNGFRSGSRLRVRIRKDETIWTESCHKFYADEICEMATAAGFECRAQWLDDTWPFAESLFTA